MQKNRTTVSGSSSAGEWAKNKLADKFGGSSCTFLVDPIKKLARDIGKPVRIIWVEAGLTTMEG